MKIATLSSLFISVFLVLFTVFAGPAYAEDEPLRFDVFLEQLRSEALEQGISEKTLDLAFAELKAPQKKVVQKDRTQPEVKQTLEKYLKNRTDKARIDTGRKMLKTYPTWLNRIERKYGVPKRILVSLWGIESHYGKSSGSIPVAQSLTTLIYEGRRAAFFKKELFVALRLADDGLVPLAGMYGSWAGAMGQFQFMPSSVRVYAVDEDNSGTIDLWKSVPDSLGSAANYLDQVGWVRGQSWGRRVKLPKNFDYSQVGLKIRQPVTYWRGLGIKKVNGGSLPGSAMAASVIMPDGPQGSAYLVYDNFRVLMRWNRSQLFAITVGELANRF